MIQEATGKVTVRKLPSYMLPTWAIYRDGIRLPAFVVDQHGLSVWTTEGYPERALRQVTVLHGGITPGDLARLVIGEGRFIRADDYAAILSGGPA